MDDKKIKKDLKEIPSGDRASAWEAYVRAEVNHILDIYLPESITGNIGIKYDHPSLKFDPKAGKQILDDKKTNGVAITLVFEFADTIEFFDGMPEDTNSVKE